MTTGRSPAWFARPRVVLPIIAVVIGVSVLFAPSPVAGRRGDPRLTTYSTQPQGAKLFAEFAERSGWSIERARTEGFPSRAGVVHAVLAPDKRIAPADVHNALQHVRNGGGLLLVLGQGTSAFSDSLGLRDAPSGYTSDTSAVKCRPSVLPRADRLWPADQAYVRSFTISGSSPPLESEHIVMVDRSTFRGGRMTASPGLAMVGATLGKGRIVIAADPDILRNDAVRVCSYGLDVAAARALAFLVPDAGATRVLRFDEFHHGYGPRLGGGDGVSGAVRAFLVNTTVGRAIAQLLLAALVLLLALAPRGVAPVDPERIERRSPFEHVDALARAYAQVGATRTAAARMVRGLRRRTERVAVRTRGADDTEFLNRLIAQHPTLTADIERVQQALAERVPAAELLGVGDAVVRIEHHILDK